MLCMQTNTHTNNRKDCINVHVHIETQIGKEVGFQQNTDKERWGRTIR